jgi:hypothetical protein
VTWYAQQVFAEPQPMVIDALCSLAGMQNALYHVPHLNESEVDEQIADGVVFAPEDPMGLQRTVRRGPKLPTGGLLVLRELCAPGPGTAEWFGDDAASWEALAATGARLTGRMADLDRLFEGAPDWWKGVAPPMEVLGTLKAIATSTRSVISYFVCHMWGGDTECAFAWVWDCERDTSVFYRAKLATDSEGQERNIFYTDTTGAFAIDDTSRRFVVDGDVLTLVLLHHGVMLQKGYFELHTRSFPWERYRLPGTASPNEAG